MQEKQKPAKTMHQGAIESYRYDSGQISVDDFVQPIGMNIKADNRWVQKAHKIHWVAVEEWYARLFPSNKGNEAKPPWLALGARIIQSEYGYPDEEAGLQILENPYLQYFCGFKEYDDGKSPTSPPGMVYLAGG